LAADILDEFSAVKIEEKKFTATTTTPSQGSSSAAPLKEKEGQEPNLSDEDLQKQLEENLLASLLGDEAMVRSHKLSCSCGSRLPMARNANDAVI
jgi:hypothetical protein